MTAELSARAVDAPSAVTPAVTPLQAWITQLLQARGLKVPGAQPLHRYQLCAQELAALKVLLREQRAHLEHPSWAACFCLCAAESYRREHGAEASAFDWKALEESLECPLEDEPRIQLIETGLSYWKRPPLAHEDAAGLAAMLSREGGLPWKLVQSHAPEIDAAIRQALRRFHLTLEAGQTSAGLLAERAQQLPAVFRGLDTRELLAGIVEQLVFLAREHPLAEHPEPAAYLDQQAPGWKTPFPLPADEPEAAKLLGAWLGEAAARQQAATATRVPGCRHRLLEGASSRWRLVAELSLPAEDSFSVDLRSLTSTRLVAAVYEGERLALNAGTVHAVAQEEGLKVQYPPLALVVERQNLREPLSLRLLESGRAIHVLPFEGSALDSDEQPLVFVSRDDEHWLAASASCSLADSEALIRLPPGAEHDPATTELFTEEGGARWISASGDLTVRHKGDVYKIELQRTGPAPAAPALQGTRAPLPAGPGRAFLGWPSLAPSGDAGEPSSPYEIFIGGKPLAAHTGLAAGSIRVSVRSRAGDTQLKERISVLPPGLALSVVPASGSSPAKVIVTGAAGASWTLSGEGISASGEDAEDPLTIPLTLQGLPPAGLNLELGSPGLDPVILPLAYPYPGARLIDQSGRESRARDLTLEELREARIVLAPASASGQELHLQLDLLASSSMGLRHHHIIRVGDSPAVVSLGGYLGLIQQMLGSVDDPDAYVRLAVETDQPLLQINIRRFGALLESLGDGTHRVSDMHLNGSARSGVVALAMPLSPAAGGSHAVEADADLINAADLAGSWLIYPGADSSIRFRPDIHSAEGGAEPPVSSALLQPVADAELIDPLLKSMAADLDHEGWQRLDALKTGLGHLPLATFQVWRSISRQPDALAAALLRLSADERFCGRIHDELAVLWEAIPVETWVKACARFRSWAGTQGLLPAQLTGLLENRQRLLHAVVPGLDSTGDYLSRGQRPPLKKPPIELVLPYHYQELRRTHQANARWPTELAAPLSTWLDRQRLPRIIKKLSNTAYSDAVTYLPIYMAHVTAGKASLASLPGDPAYVRLVIRKISEFDRGWYLYVHSLLVSYLLAADS